MWVAVNFAIVVLVAVGAYAWLALNAIADGGEAWRWVVAFPTFSGNVGKGRTDTLDGAVSSVA